jgi:hypothetical protein
MLAAPALPHDEDMRRISVARNIGRSVVVLIGRGLRDRRPVSWSIGWIPHGGARRRRVHDIEIIELADCSVCAARSIGEYSLSIVYALEYLARR